MRLATSLAVKWSGMGSNMREGEKRSWITMMCLHPLEVLKGPRKSMAIDFHRHVGIGRDLGGPGGLTVDCLFRWQMSQVLQYC